MIICRLFGRLAPRGLTCLLAIVLLASTLQARNWRQLVKEKRHEEAFAALEELAQKEPSGAAGFFENAVNLALKLKDGEKALAYADRVQDKSFSAYLRFVVLMDLGRTEEALALLELAPPENMPPAKQTQVYYRLGNYHKSNGDREKALSAYESLMQLPVGNITMWSWGCKHAADIYKDLGNTPKMLECYRRCLDNKVFLASRNETLFAYTDYLVKEGRVAEALELLEKEKPGFTSGEPGYWMYAFLRQYARILAASGSRVQAVEIYDRIESLGAGGALLGAVRKERQALIDELVAEL